jgi:alpha-muurolene/germacrene-A/gamma-muurolene synthase
MYDRGYALQDAVDFVGGMIQNSIRQFLEDQKNVPSFGPEIDEQADTYIRGIRDWVAGSVNWNLMTERYGMNGEVAKTLVVPVMKPEKALVGDGLLGVTLSS